MPILDVRFFSGESFWTLRSCFLLKKSGEIIRGLIMKLNEESSRFRPCSSDPPRLIRELPSVGLLECFRLKKCWSFMLRLLLDMVSLLPGLKSFGSLIYLEHYLFLYKIEIRHCILKLVLVIGRKIPHRVNFFGLEYDRKNLVVNFDTSIILTNLVQNIFFLLLLLVLQIQNFLLVVLA